ncbi:porin, partial [Brucella anthropi]|uniref:porin n=1 Tax=Brucella anthropi TaxID=529 RepID=UPI0013AB3486
VKGGDDAYTGFERGGWDKSARFALRFSTGSETELGTLKTYTELRYNWNGGGDGEEDAYGSSENSSLRYAYIQLGGLRVGLDE